MSAETVKTGIVAADSAIRRAIVACVGVSSRTLISPLPATGSCAGSAGAVRLGRRSGHVVDGDPPARARAGELVERDAELDGGAARDRRRVGPSRAGVVGGTPTSAAGCGRRRVQPARAPPARAVRRRVLRRRRSRASRSARRPPRSHPPGRGSSRACRRTPPRRPRSPCRSRPRSEPSPRANDSPGAFSQRRMTASAIESDSFGMVSSRGGTAVSP